MKLPAWGAFIAVGLLAGCFAPVAKSEALQIAQTRIDKYCRGRCGALTLANAQKIKDRWLVDFEAPRHKFTVTVEDNGNAAVSVWDKAPAPR